MPTRQPGGPSRRELQRAASVSRIVAAAEHLLSESSRFSEISVEQVISRAGVSRSTFYSYFDDMGHLLRVVSEGVVGEVVGSVREWMDFDSGVSEEDLTRIFRGLVDVYRHRAVLLAALADASTYDSGVREEFHRLLAIGHVEVAKHIRRAQESGAAWDDIDPDATAAWLVWMIERGLYQQIRPAREADLDRHVGALASIVRHSLYREAQ
jgi:AcrR family transcriptional regulator